MGIKLPWQKKKTKRAQLGPKSYTAIDKAMAAEKPTAAQLKLLAAAKKSYGTSRGAQKKQLGKSLGMGGGAIGKARRKVQKAQGYDELKKVGSKASPKKKTAKVAREEKKPIRRRK